MAKQRKTVSMLVTVTVPIDMTPGQVRLVVRTLINDARPGDVKARKVSATEVIGKVR